YIIMNTLIKNIGHLYSPDENGDYGDITNRENVAISIKDGNIEKIHPERNPSLDSVDRVIDAKGLTVLPGFVDAHTHPVFWKTREAEFVMRNQGKSYEEIAATGGGIRNSARSFHQAGKSEIKSITKNRIKTFLEYGTTTIEAKSGYGLSREGEIKALEIISELNNEQKLEMVPTFLGAHEIPDDYRSRREKYIQLIIEEMLPEIAERQLAEYCDVFCEKGVFTIEETRKILKAAEDYGLKSRIHADELHAFGAAELAAEIEAATADHLVMVSDKGIKAMAEKKVIPVLLPATTFFLRKDQYAPARKMLSNKCEVALATDFNPGSSMTQNMPLVWTIAALKLGMVTGELLWATTIIPAKSLRREKEIGSIDVGKQADLVLMDIPNLDYLAYHMGINHVMATIKKGEILFKKEDR
ncbi:MAG: imidazolonepropionase, partial [Calditrichia bacterium]